MPDKQVAILVAVDDGRQVAAVIDDQVQGRAVGKEERLLDAPIVLSIGLALPGVDRHTRFGHGGGGVVLRGKLVATAPRHLGTQLGSVSISTAV